MLYGLKIFKAQLYTTKPFPNINFCLIVCGFGGKEDDDYSSLVFAFELGSLNCNIVF